MVAVLQLLSDDSSSSSSSPSESKMTSSVSEFAHMCLEPEGGCADLATELIGYCSAGI